MYTSVLSEAGGWLQQASPSQSTSKNHASVMFWKQQGFQQYCTYRIVFADFRQCSYSVASLQKQSPLSQVSHILKVTLPRAESPKGRSLKLPRGRAESLGVDAISPKARTSDKGSKAHRGSTCTSSSGHPNSIFTQTGVLVFLVYLKKIGGVLSLQRTSSLKADFTDVLSFLCTAEDLCKQNNGGCHKAAECTQLGVKVFCSCQKGYKGDGFTCLPINPCADGFNGGCHEHAICTVTGPVS